MYVYFFLRESNKIVGVPDFLKFNPVTYNNIDQITFYPPIPCKHFIYNSAGHVHGTKYVRYFFNNNRTD